MAVLFFRNGAHGQHGHREKVDKGHAGEGVFKIRIETAEIVDGHEDAGEQEQKSYEDRSRHAGEVCFQFFSV